MTSRYYNKYPLLLRALLVCLAIALPFMAGCSLIGFSHDDAAQVQPPQGLVWDEHSTRQSPPAPKVRPLASTKLQQLTPPATPQAVRLGKDLDELLTHSALAKGNGILGIAVVNLADNTLIYERNAHTKLVPASNMKLFTTAAALEMLSPDYVYETTFEINGNLSQGSVQGDLVVRGSGDPTIAARNNGWNTLAVFTSWARELKQKGISVIHGDLIGDASFFKRFVYCPGWDPRDEPVWYAAQTGALSLNENTIKIFARPGKTKGSPVRIELDPETSHVRVENTAKTGSRKSRDTLAITRRCGENTIVVSGSLPTRSREVVRTLTIDDPATFFMDVLAQVFAAQGITVTGKVRVVREPNSIPKGLLVLRHTSPRLSQLIDFTNTESNNFYAEQLLRTIGGHLRGSGSREDGAAVISSWMTSMGVPRQEFTMIDGSGLSRHNSISPYAVITLLRAMHASPYGLIYKNSLPIAGEKGTLRRRMRGTLAQSQVKAKTGYMKGVTSLGGYTESLDGQPLAFSIIYNGRHPSTSYVKSLENDICVLLRSHETGLAENAAPQNAPAHAVPPADATPQDVSSPPGLDKAA